jgi:hypothetical protein
VQIGAKSPEEGARTAVYLASSEEVNRISGKFFINCNVVSSDPATYDEETWRKLWIASEKLCGIEGITESAL